MVRAAAAALARARSRSAGRIGAAAAAAFATRRHDAGAELLRLCQMLAQRRESLGGEAADILVLGVARGLLEHFDVLLVFIDHVFDELLIEIVTRCLAQAAVGAIFVIV